MCKTKEQRVRKIPEGCPIKKLVEWLKTYYVLFYILGIPFVTIFIFQSLSLITKENVSKVYYYTLLFDGIALAVLTFKNELIALVRRIKNIAGAEFEPLVPLENLRASIPEASTLTSTKKIMDGPKAENENKQKGMDILKIPAEQADGQETEKTDASKLTNVTKTTNVVETENENKQKEMDILKIPAEQTDGQETEKTDISKLSTDTEVTDSPKENNESIKEFAEGIKNAHFYYIFWDLNSTYVALENPSWPKQQFDFNLRQTLWHFHMAGLSQFIGGEEIETVLRNLINETRNISLYDWEQKEHKKIIAKELRPLVFKINKIIDEMAQNKELFCPVGWELNAENFQK